MWANEYGALKKQNRKRFDALCLADRNTITVAMESIQNASWNLYEVERVRKDLIDMAEKAKEEGKTLAEALGPDRRRVFDEMAREIESGDFVDWLCQYGSWYYLPFHAGVVLFQALLGQTEHLMLLVLLTPMFLLTALDLGQRLLPGKAGDADAPGFGRGDPAGVRPGVSRHGHRGGSWHHVGGALRGA